MRQGKQFLVDSCFGTLVRSESHSSQTYLIFDVPSVLAKGIESFCDAVHFEKLGSRVERQAAVIAAAKAPEYAAAVVDQVDRSTLA